MNFNKVAILFISLFFALKDLYAQQDQEKVNWLKNNLSAIRTIDPSDDNFKDLKSVKRAIGDAQIVILAEPDHGNGSTFLAKSRLVKYLHQNMNFDVLAFESDFYTLNRIAATAPVNEASDEARKNVNSFWSQTKQTKALWDYIKQTTLSANKLEVAGFTARLNSDYAKKNFIADLDSMFLKTGIDSTLLVNRTKFTIILKALLDNNREKPVAKEDQVWFLNVLESLQTEVQKNGNASLLNQLLVNIKGAAQGNWQGAYHDKNMAENVLWLVNERYKGKKIILWMASLHAVKDLAHVYENDKERLARLNSFAEPDMLTSITKVVQRQSPVKTYILHFVPVSGEYTPRAWENDFTKRELIQVPENSIESSVLKTPFSYSFIDFNAAKKDSWIKGTFSMAGIYPHNRMFDAQWSKIYDGLFFIKNMEGIDKL